MTKRSAATGTTPNWLNHFPGLSKIPQDIRDALAANSQIIELPANSAIFGPGQAPRNFLLLIQGTIRVQQVSESGREIVLYRVSAGESCALTTACLLGYEDYQAEGIAETDIRAVAIPRSKFDELIAASGEFRRFIFTAFSSRVSSLFQIIDEIAFQRLDIRLAQRIVELSHGAKSLNLTHQQLASELGSAREVISRQLHEFQRRGWVQVSRGHIELLDLPALSRLAAM